MSILIVNTTQFLSIHGCLTGNSRNKISKKHIAEHGAGGVVHPAQPGAGAGDDGVRVPVPQDVVHVEVIAGMHRDDA